MRADPSTRVALVVEDEWLLRDHIVSELKARGWSVVDAANGEATLAVIASQRIDVLVTDIQLAGLMNGWAVAHAFRAAKPDVPVIYASANAPDASRRLEGSLFFDKPYDVGAIAEACHRLLSTGC